jgi:hypothetical protein
MCCKEEGKSIERFLFIFKLTVYQNLRARLKHLFNFKETWTEKNHPDESKKNTYTYNGHFNGHIR